MLKKIKNHSPKEIYALLIIYVIALFLNFAEFFRSSIDFADIFNIRGSVVFGLIQGIGDDRINSDEAAILYWVTLITLVLVVHLKAKKISTWLWDR